MTKKLFLYISIAGIFVSCREKNVPEPETPLPQRTVIAYFCGDNNLSSEVDEKTEALRKGMKNIGKTDNNLIVYADYNDKMPKLSKITENGVVVLRDYSEQNSASPVVFSEVLQTVTNDFPAKSYGLICFSHASGWLPEKALNNPENFAASTSASSTPTRSIFEDKGLEMSISEFAEAIPELPEGEKFDFIIFETCYMAGVEIAYELRNKTKRLLSSSAEILSNGFVEIYPEHLAGLFEPQPRLNDFARAYFNFRNNLSGTSRSATVSVINTAGMENLAKIAGEICRNGDNVDAKNIQYFNRNNYHLFFDFADYIQSTAKGNQLSDFRDILSQIVEYQASTPYFMSGYPYAFTIGKHCGLTTYIKQAQFPDLNEEYDKLAWAKALDY